MTAVAPPPPVRRQEEAPPRQRSLARWLLDVAPPRAGELQLVEELGPKGRRRALAATVAATALIVAAAIWVVRRFQARGQFAPELWRPFRQWAIWRFLLIGLGNTLKAAAIAFVLSLTIGVLMAVLRAGPSRPARVASAVYVEGFRACALVLLITFLFYQLSHWFEGWSLQRYALIAVIAGLTLYYSTVFAEVVRSGIRSIPRGQTEAGLSIGLTESRALVTIVLPQAMRRALPNLVTQAASLLKDTSLGVFVTYDELLNRADQLGGFADNKLQAFVVAGSMYIAVIALLTATANRLQQRQSGSSRKRKVRRG